MTEKKPDVPSLKHWFHNQMLKHPLRRIHYIVSLTFEILLSNKQAWKKWSRLKIYWTTVCFLSVTFPHSEGVLPDLGSCSPVGRRQQRSDSGPPCQPPDPSAPSAAWQTWTNSRLTNTQNTLCVCVCTCARTCLSMAFLSSSRSCLEDLSCMSSERSWSIWSLLLATRSVIISALLLSSSSSNSKRFSLSWQRWGEIDCSRCSEGRLCVLDNAESGHVSI